MFRLCCDQSFAVINLIVTHGEIAEPSVYHVHPAGRIRFSVSAVHIEGIVRENGMVSPAFCLIVYLECRHDLRILIAEACIVMDKAVIAGDVDEAAGIVFTGHTVTEKGASRNLRAGCELLDINVFRGDIPEGAVQHLVAVTFVVKALDRNRTADVYTFAVTRPVS